MIVYKELSSLAHDLGFSAKVLYSVSNSLSKHYKNVQIQKKNGGIRQLSVPDDLLKKIQARIYKTILHQAPVSHHATAYRLGGSTKRNATPHVGKAVVLKLDIRHFFDHIFYPLVKERVFSAEKFSEPNRVLLSLLCTYKDALPQGAPTSPPISNIVLFDFDNATGMWCNERGISYTRYCDDMTFSGNFDPKIVIDFVKTELYKYGLFLNHDKTTVLRQGRCQCVTGIVVNKKACIPSGYKRKIRQEIYYIKKYGVEEHRQRIGFHGTTKNLAARLMGKINYVLSVEPENDEMRSYKQVLTNIA